jgi:hypothetical protein
MDEERVEGDLVGAGERAGGVEGDLLALPMNEAFEAITRLELSGVEALLLGGGTGLRLGHGDL